MSYQAQIDTRNASADKFVPFSAPEKGTNGNKQQKRIQQGAELRRQTGKQKKGNKTNQAAKLQTAKKGKNKKTRAISINAHSRRTTETN